MTSAYDLDFALEKLQHVVCLIPCLSKYHKEKKFLPKPCKNCLVMVLWWAILPHCSADIGHCTASISADAHTMVTGDNATGDCLSWPSPFETVCMLSHRAVATKHRACG